MFPCQSIECERSSLQLVSSEEVTVEGKSGDPQRAAANKDLARSPVPPFKYRSRSPVDRGALERDAPTAPAAPGHALLTGPKPERCSYEDGPKQGHTGRKCGVWSHPVS